MKVRLLILLILVCATLILISKSITSAYSNHQESQASAQRKIASLVMERTGNGKELLRRARMGVYRRLTREEIKKHLHEQRGK
ncbi:MAG: hypothetical protein ACREEM_25715 [Blastocatellia bacterium]